MSIADNIAAPLPPAGSAPGGIDDGQQRSAAEELCRSLRVACRGPDEPVRNLSGGNQQKVVAGQWLLARAARADRGRADARRGRRGQGRDPQPPLRSGARGARPSLVISSDLPEVLAVADRILVMREGRMARRTSPRRGNGGGRHGAGLDGRARSLHECERATTSPMNDATSRDGDGASARRSTCCW